MENPTFRLEGIVKTKDDFEDFEGPLTLILQLLSKNKIEIKDIQVSQILEQYLAYLDEMKSMDLEVASEFVAMASHLIYIKTRMLLSADDEEVSELEQLISSLENLKAKDTYTKIQAVIAAMQSMFRRGGNAFVKPPEYIEPDTAYKYSHEKNDLLEAIKRVFDRGDSAGAVVRARPFVMPQRITYPVTEKADEIVERLRRCDAMRLRALFLESKSRTELVATFMAVLELCRAGRIYFSGTEDDLIISGAAGACVLQELEEQGDADGNS